MMLHRCTGIRVDSHNKSNANAITLEILRRDKQAVSLVLFELPEFVTDQLLSAFADTRTANHNEPNETGNEDAIQRRSDSQQHRELESDRADLL